MLRNLFIYKCGDTFKYVSVLQHEKKSSSITPIEEDTRKKEKFYNNLVRAKSTIKDLILTNNFYFFITITFNSNYDRKDLKHLRLLLNNRIRKARQKYNLDLKFIFVPELHKDGENWHFHRVVK